jgi:hypothetical protein
MGPEKDHQGQAQTAGQHRGQAVGIDLAEHAEGVVKEALTERKGGLHEHRVLGVIAPKSVDYRL